MNSAQKTQRVKDLSEKFSKAKVAVLSRLDGLSAEKANSLRKAMRESLVDFAVVKNTLAKRAVEGTDFEALKEQFKGPVVVALSYDDVIAPAKVLEAFIKDNKKGLEIAGGVMDGKVLSADDVKRLATLPNLDESRSMLLSLMLAPATKLVRTLAEGPTSFVRTLNGRKEKLEQEG